ncbi:MAG: hypothetical protein ABUK20_04260 [Anaerolineales bacterium]
MRIFVQEAGQTNMQSTAAVLNKTSGILIYGNPILDQRLGGVVVKKLFAEGNKV